MRRSLRPILERRRRNMLTVEGLRSRYGRIEVLHGIDLTVNSGEIVTVVGANGAGKTTLLRCLSGVQPVSGGSITFRGDVITTVPGYKRLRRGLAQSPEGRQIFTNLTVEENLRLGAFLFSDDRVDRDMEDAFQMFPILKEKRNLAAGGLSGGQQQMLAIARALMGRPSCLLLDEPSMGLAPILVQQIFDVISGLKAVDVTVLLVEQNAFGALKIADRGYVMETGKITMDGPAAELIADPRIREAYLGI
jgi:branched-chain amino acid transport system ATP-binding protein